MADNLLRFQHGLRPSDESGRCIPDSQIRSHSLDHLPVNCLGTKCGHGRDTVSKASITQHARMYLQLRRSRSLLRRNDFCPLGPCLRWRNYFWPFGPWGPGRTVQEEKCLPSEMGGKKGRRMLRTSPPPTGTLIVVINTINLSLLLITKVISLENFRSVSHLFWMRALAILFLSCVLCLRLSPPLAFRGPACNL